MLIHRHFLEEKPEQLSNNTKWGEQQWERKALMHSRTLAGLAFWEHSIKARAVTQLGTSSQTYSSLKYPSAHITPGKGACNDLSFENQNPMNDDRICCMLISPGPTRNLPTLHTASSIYLLSLHPSAPHPVLWNSHPLRPFGSWCDSPLSL